MSRESPIIIQDDCSPEQLHRIDTDHIIKLLSPTGIAPILEDSFTQSEFNGLENRVLDRIVQFCHQNLPRDYVELMNGVELYRYARDTFAEVSFIYLFIIIFLKIYNANILFFSLSLFFIRLMFT